RRKRRPCERSSGRSSDIGSTPRRRGCSPSTRDGARPRRCCSSPREARGRRTCRRSSPWECRRGRRSRACATSTPRPSSTSSRTGRRGRRVATKTAGKARRSQLVGTYGVGAIFPAEAESYLICGLDHWYEKAAPVVHEPRLAAALNVNAFRQPPAAGHAGVPVVRFPEWHYCPKCRVLGEHWRIGDKKRGRCKQCRVDLVPSRFVACCPAGHIQDFPYFRWLHRQGEAGARADHRMTIEARGQSSSLADIVLGCSCGVRPRSLEGAMNQGGLAGVTRCFGERRWLPG